MDLRASTGRAVVALLGAAGLALAGCTSQTGDLESVDSPLARYDWDATSGMSALLEGTLTLHDQCIYVASDTGEVVAAFPRSLTRWDADAQTLFFDETPYAIGSPIAAGGGFIQPSDDIEGLSIPTACDLGEYGEVFLVQDTDLAP
ncbi:hypothetical protein [Demequina sp. NBRC 110056]|uniref:hypothetical protein n=1 Tax=Demequina sp. NBRC 110056 TaxID=1570345 RepID=UPI0009FFBD90|nr:hypothetical protein [Demequina sp. NBRC 110056]